VSRRLLHILTPPPEDQNVTAFLAPLVANRNLLREAGITVRCFAAPQPTLADCDVLILNSAVWRGPWSSQRDRALPFIAAVAEQVPRLLFFDRTSTAGTVIPDVLPLVHRYYKTNLLRDRALYLRALYGLRQFTDYYHRCFDVIDAEPVWSSPVPDPRLLNKLRLSWNTALGNYSLLGPRLGALYARFPLAALMRPAKRFHPPSANRPIDLSCRMGLRYKYETVAFQRRRMAELLQAYRRTDRISKFAYQRELRRSRIVASPFGFSEVNYKDFETFLAGALLLKPDMGHLETYPPLFEDGVTYVAHRWDFSDLSTVVARLLDQYAEHRHIAEAGQERYRSFTAAPGFGDRFVSYFEELLEEADSDAAPLVDAGSNSR